MTKKADAQNDLYPTLASRLPPVENAWPLSMVRVHAEEDLTDITIPDSLEKTEKIASSSKLEPKQNQNETKLIPLHILIVHPSLARRAHHACPKSIDMPHYMRLFSYAGPLSRCGLDDFV